VREEVLLMSEEINKDQLGKEQGSQSKLKELNDEKLQMQNQQLDYCDQERKLLEDIEEAKRHIELLKKLLEEEVEEEKELQSESQKQ